MLYSVHDGRRRNSPLHARHTREIVASRSASIVAMRLDVVYVVVLLLPASSCSIGIVGQGSFGTSRRSKFSSKVMTASSLQLLTTCIKVLPTGDGVE